MYGGHDGRVGGVTSSLVELHDARFVAKIVGISAVIGQKTPSAISLLGCCYKTKAGINIVVSFIEL